MTNIITVVCLFCKLSRLRAVTLKPVTETHLAWCALVTVGENPCLCILAHIKACLPLQDEYTKLTVFWAAASCVGLG